MRLALIIDDYLPDSTRVGAKMMHELAIEFMHHGHEIVIITPGDNKQENRLTKSVIDDVEVWKFRNGSVKDVSRIKRAINETLMSFNAWLAIRHEVKNKPFAGVVYYSPSIFFGPLVKKLKRSCECRSYLILRDLFPQWVIDDGILREKSLITKYFRYFENINYKAADAIGLMSPKNLELFSKKQPELEHLHVLYNWASTDSVQNINPKNSIRIKLGLEDKTIFFYGGNIGHAQDMANLLRLAQSLKEHENAHFLFVGQGDEVDLIKRLVIEWHLENVSILPSVSQSAFKDILFEVDIGLFSLAKAHTAHNFPGKLLGYMTQSIPILGSVNKGNDLLNAVNDAQAGCVFINGEDDALLNASKLLLNDKNERIVLGNNAKNLLVNCFAIESTVKTISKYLQ
jgi:glycosyltransferase involved in cell wall biosynthesis